MPVVEITPPVVARPWSCVSRLNPFHVESALSAGSSDFGINMHPLHRREVYHYAAVYCRTASDVVTSSAHSNFEVPLARQSYRIDDVSRTAALRDDSRSLVYQAVVDSSGGLVGWVGWLKNPAGEGLG